MYNEGRIRRGFEIKEFYFIAMKIALRRGMNYHEAINQANYCVDLFYNLTPRSRQNIVQQYNTERRRKRNLNPREWDEYRLRSVFAEKIKQMLSVLKEVGDEVQ